jgi:hypothetical protein
MKKNKCGRTTMTTTFSDKCEILGELWMDYREDQEFEDFIEYNDLGLPLAYMIASGVVVAPTDRAKDIIEETFDLFLGAMNIKDTGFETLSDVFDQSVNPPE